MTDSLGLPRDADIPTYRLIFDPPLTVAQADRRRNRGIPVVPRGSLVDAQTGEVLISASLSYIEAAIAERGLVVVSREERPGAGSL